jgi:hypothetical protein
MKLLSLSLLTALAVNAQASSLNLPKPGEITDGINQAFNISKKTHRPVVIVFAGHENADGATPAVVVEGEEGGKDISDTNFLDRISVNALFGVDATTKMNEWYPQGSSTVKGNGVASVHVGLKLFKNGEAYMGGNTASPSGSRLRLGGRYLIHDGATHVNNPRETKFDNATETMDVYVYGEGSPGKSTSDNLNLELGVGLGFIKNLNDKLGAVAEVGIDDFGKSALGNRILGLRVTGGIVVKNIRKLK